MAEWLSYLDTLSKADQKGLLLPAPQPSWTLVGTVRKRFEADWERHERAIRPSLFSRLKARAARVTWDSWG